MDNILLAGADKARQLATPFMREVRHAVGLRPLSSGIAAVAAKESKTAVASFKQYREKDGQFYFKLVDAQGQVLLQSRGFASPKDAGQTITQLQTGNLHNLSEWAQVLETQSPEQQALALEALKKMLNSQKTIK
jgi:tryptophanyl-tRNA synthetase